MNLPRSLLAKYALFAVLGLADLALTYYLLRTSTGAVYESNPVAHWWLLRYGWAGLAAFKLTAILLVVLAVKVMARYRPRTASHVLSFACGATALVIGYSCTLLGEAHGQGHVRRLRGMTAIQAEASALDKRIDQLRAYEHCRNRAAADLNAGRSSLDEAVIRVAATEWAQDPGWQKALRDAYPGRPDAECLAALVLEQARLLEGLDPPDGEGASE